MSSRSPEAVKSTLVQEPTGYDILKNSWIGRAGKVPEDILQRLGKNPTFQQYVGLSLLAQRPDSISTKDSNSMWDYVASGFAATDAMLNSGIWANYKRGHQYIHPSITLRKQESFLTAEIKLRTFLQTQLLNNRGFGNTIQSLAEKFMRYGELTEAENGGTRIKNDAVDYMRVYIRTKNGEIFTPPAHLQKDARYWSDRDWRENLSESREFDSQDEAALFEQFKYQNQPLRDEQGRYYIRTRKGVIYKPDENLQREASIWGLNEWIKQLESYIRETDTRDAAFVTEEIDSGRQPLVQIDFDIDQSTPWTAIPYWGSRLPALAKETILSLAKGGFCDPSCQQYHGYAREQKELGELIAPVDGEFFASELLDSYKLWMKDHTVGAKFRVLIPAQADETTILGILNDLSFKGITTEELKQNFSLVLADLCPTPLLSIYAHLRERNLLDIANIVSMDVFNWAEEMEEKFEFVAADHFIDLFPQDGEFSQSRVLTTLVSSLAKGGKLVLTARCGTGEDILTRDKVMGEFYIRCQNHIKDLTTELEIADATSVENYYGKYSNVFSTKQELARGIYALTAYLTLRDVNPIPNIENLNSTLAAHMDESVNFSVIPLKGKRDKVSIQITK